MDLDNYLNNINSDLERQMAELNNSFGSVMGTNTSAASLYHEQPSEELQDFMFCPECGTKLPADSKFCSNCGTKVGNDTSTNSATNEEFYDGEMSHGIIWTDTKILAEKYGESRQDILQFLNSYISESENYDIQWSMIDMADHQHELGEGTWMDYSDVLQQFMKDNGIKPSPKLALFIIGGNDVIPQPAEKNPCGDPEDEYQERVFADFYYCFYGKLPLDFLDFNKARCNVARLPLEMGEMETSFNDDVANYLRDCLSVADDDGISIGNAVMTSNVDWIPASREMSRNLPTPHMDNVEGETLDNMYLSPGVLADMDEDLADQYYDSLSNADMIVFNLHGACQPSYSGFYSTDLAFSIDMLEHSNARIFNTVACWGGRYIKYKREDSMLLNALYNNNVLLYSGACVPALGKCGNYQCDSTWRIQPAAYSETFMARFSEYQCIGTMPAGEAFLKAKCDYYNSSRSIEEDEYTLGTVLMFNLYGCPLLRTQPDVEVIESMQEEDGSKKQRVPFRKMNRRIVMKGENMSKSQSSSLLDDIRSAVDTNLRLIHQSIVDNLYNELGVSPRELYSVESYSTTDYYGVPQKGYIYNYRQKQGFISTQIIAKVDEKGKLLSAIQTK